jgi:hypothetical protein
MDSQICKVQDKRKLSQEMANNVHLPLYQKLEDISVLEPAACPLTMINNHSKKSIPKHSMHLSSSKGQVKE